MNPERFRRMEELFQSAMALTESERSAFIDRACHGDSSLSREVKALLAEHARSSTFLERPAAGRLEADADVRGHDIGPNDRLGNYRIERLLVAGGMGTVWLGHRDDDQFEKRVAIKIVKKDLRGADVVDRFRFEREVLAQLQHANIAHLLDGGVTPDGRPYFVMEFVEGLPIDEFVRTHDNLGIDERLALFVRVCRAVAYAHQRLVIHRDIKPNNILVTPEGQPKLLDFGLAKSLDDRDINRNTPLTLDSGFMGTIAYAAPEQITGKRNAIDVRTDVYALGVTFYRMLTGEFPFDLRGSLADAVQKITGTEPIRLSTWQRDVNPELETIIHKAMAADPQRRYQSVSAMIEDIERFRAGLPIVAYQDSTRWRWYVYRKMIRRHWLKLGTAALFILTILVAALALAALAGRLARQRDIAELALHQSHIELGRLYMVDGNTDLAERILWSEHLKRESSTERRRDDHSLAPMPETQAYWALWELYMRQPCLRTVLLQGGSVHLGSAISPDGAVALVNRSDGSLKMIDTDSPAAHWESLAHQAPVCAAIFTPPGDRIMTFDEFGTVMTWDARTGRHLRTTNLKTDIANACANADLTILAVARTAGAISVHQTSNENTLHLLEFTDEPATAMAISPESRWLAAGSKRGNLRLWNLETGQMIWTDQPHARGVAAIAFTPDGRRLASAGFDHVVKVFDVTDGAIQHEFAEHESHVTAIAISADGRSLASGGFDKTIRVWDLTTGELIRAFKGHGQPIIDIRFTPDGRLLRSLDSECIKTWEIGATAFPTEIGRANGTIFGVALDPEGERIALASGDDDAALRIWNAESGARHFAMEDHPAAVSDVVFVDRGKRIIACNYAGVVFERDLAMTEPVELFRTSRGFNALDVDDSKQLIAAAGDDGRAFVWDRRAKRMLHVFDTGTRRVADVAISPNGTWLAATTSRARVTHVWNLRTGAQHLRWEPHDLATRPVAFSPNGTSLATAGDDNTVAVWRLADGRLLKRLIGHKQDIFALAFSPDGRQLASGGRDGMVKLWSAESGQLLTTFEAHEGMVFDMAFAPGGRFLVTGGSDHRAFRWDLAYFDTHIEGNRKAHEMRSGSHPSQRR